MICINYRRNFLILFLLIANFSFGQLAGQLDSTFNFDGKLTASLTYDDRILALSIQSDGKIVTGGSAIPDSGGYTQFNVSRFNTDGSFDLSFGTNSNVITPIPAFASNNCSVNSIIIQPDGKIIASGRNQSDCVVVRYLNSGIQDSIFGTNGIAIIPILNTDYIEDAVLTPDGKIYAGGASNANNTPDIVVMRLNVDGTLDTSFNHTGKLTFDFGSNEVLNSLALQPDDKLLLSGNSGSLHSLVIRINSNGTLDTSFNHTGIFAIDTLYITTIALQADGKIVCGGEKGADFAVARLNSDGSFDNSFTFTVQSIQSDDDIMHRIKILPNGKIVAAGSSSIYDGMFWEYNFALACFNTDGNVDLTLGNNGIVSTDFYGGDELALDMDIGPDNKIVLGGGIYLNGKMNMAIARYFSGLVGINEFSRSNGISIYPNPTSSSITVESEIKRGILEVYDNLGQTVYDIVLTSPKQIIRQELTPGIYFVKVTDGEKVFTQKLVVE